MNKHLESLALVCASRVRESIVGVEDTHPSATSGRWARQLFFAIFELARDIVPVSR